MAKSLIDMKNNGTIITLDCIGHNQKMYWNCISDLDGKKTFWHSSAHILAEAVESIYPEVKFGIGPPISNGFYYDIDFMNYDISKIDIPKINIDPNSIKPNRQNANNRSTRNLLKYIKIEVITY